MAVNQTSKTRSKIMSSVRQKDTNIEMLVRRLIHRLGFRYRLHQKDLPGSPDIVFRSKKRVIFVNGCFWHGHTCPKGNLPKSRLEYWGPKIKTNRDRDRRNIESLEDLGWRVYVIWQCETEDTQELQQHILTFLSTGLWIDINS